MKILVLCGVYAEENEQEVLSNAKGYVEQSANIFQRKLIYGIQQSGVEYKVISAPFIGAYPMRYKKSSFQGFSVVQDKYEYISFNNIWGVRNISRTRALKKAIKKYFESEAESDFLIIVYCPHTPFLDAALYAKYLRPKSKVCLIVPDLPQYMNLNETGRGVYDFFKKYDIQRMEYFIAKVDSFVLLTEPMKNVLKVGKRPYIVIEGLVDGDVNASIPSDKSDGKIRIVYTGKMNIKFGIKSLVDSFMKISDPSYRLILCGDGDARSYVEEKAAIDHRIEYKGMVSSAIAREYVQSADVLVNPRKNNEEYTKYSFPSKNIEYLMTGKPVVAYMLDGIPKCYEDFMYIIPDEMDSFQQILIDASNTPFRKRDFSEYALNNLNATAVVTRIMNL